MYNAKRIVARSVLSAISTGPKDVVLTKTKYTFSNEIFFALAWTTSVPITPLNSITGFARNVAEQYLF